MVSKIKRVLLDPIFYTPCRSDLDFTIVVPANVRFRGANMTLDLKLDRIELSKAMGEASMSSASETPSSWSRTASNYGMHGQDALRIGGATSLFDESEALVDSTTVGHSQHNVYE